MAIRPVFFATNAGSQLVREQNFDFPWAPGFAEIQKKKNVQALHNAAHEAGFKEVLEISSKSDMELGRRLSAFSLKIELNGKNFPLESVYQSSKVFRDSGPFLSIIDLPPRDAKRFVRENSKGDLLKFHFLGQDFPLWPKNAFYDWLYIRSLVIHSKWIKENNSYVAFTDIEFNPQKQVNCQARAFAEYISLQKRSILEKASENFTYFASLLSPI